MEDQNQKNFYEKIISSPNENNHSCDLCEWAGGEEEVTAEYQSIKPVKEYAGSSLDSPKKIALCFVCYSELAE